jgi:hypothetical protein
MRSLDADSPSASSVGAYLIALRGLAVPIGAQARQDSWCAIEIIASRHNRRVESYLQRRRHRPWRNRGS